MTIGTFLNLPRVLLDSRALGRGTAADFTLRDTHEVERLLNELGR